MAKTSVTLKAPDTRHSRVIAPVQDNSTAAAITGATNLLTAGVGIQKKFAQAEAAEVQQGRETALTAELTNFSDEVISASAQKSLGGFQQDVNKFANLSESQAKIRTEAILRKHIASDPANTQKYRQIAGGVLGFDPTGSALAAVFDQQEATANTNAELKKEYLSLGGDINTYGTPAATAWFEEQSQYDSRLQAQSRKLEFIKQSKQLAAIDAPKELREWSGDVAATTMSTALGSVQAVFNKPLAQVTDKDIAGMDQEVLQRLVQTITEQKNAIRQKGSEQFLGLGDIGSTDIDTAVQPSMAQLDFVLNRLSLENTQKHAANKLKLEATLTTAKILNDPALRTLKIFQDNFPDIPVPVGSNEVIIKGLSAMLAGKIVDGGLGETKETRADTVTFYKSVIKGIGETGVLDNEQRDTATKLFKGLSRTSVATFEDMNQSQRDALMEILQIPEMATLVADIPESAGDAANLSFIAQDYTFKVLLSAGADLKQSFGNPLRFKQFGESGKPADHIKLITTPQGFKVVPKTRSKTGKTAAFMFNDRYIQRLNKALRATSNLDGTTMEQTINSLLGGEEFQGLESITSLMEEATTQEVLSDTGKKTQEGRPVFKNQEGDFVTERTITEDIPELNGWFNIPTVFEGKFLSPKEAIQKVIASGGKDPITGRTLTRFNTVDKAVSAAQKRSNEKLSNEMRGIK